MSFLPNKEIVEIVLIWPREFSFHVSFPRRFVLLSVRAGFARNKLLMNLGVDPIFHISQQSTPEEYPQSFFLGRGKRARVEDIGRYLRPEPAFNLSHHPFCSF